MSSLKDKIIEWNVQYPFDRIWRKKFNILYGSEEHLNTTFISMCFQLREDLLYERMKVLKEKVINTDSNNVNMSNEEINDEFDKINLEDYE